MKLPEPLKKELQSIRASVSERLDAYAKASGSLPDLQAREEDLNRRISDAEAGVDVDNPASVQQFETMKSQLAIIRRRISGLEESLLPLSEKLKESMEPAPDAIRRALNDEFEAYTAKLAKVFRPHFRNDHAARVAAVNTDAAGSFQWFLGRDYSRWGIKGARELLPVLDAILKGENPWRFEPEHKATGAAE